MLSRELCFQLDRFIEDALGRVPAHSFQKPAPSNAPTSNAPTSNDAPTSSNAPARTALFAPKTRSFLQGASTLRVADDEAQYECSPICFCDALPEAAVEAAAAAVAETVVAAEAAAAAAAEAAASSSLDEFVNARLEEGFSTLLLHYIDRDGRKDSEIYRKAGIDRRHFSKIRSNQNYHPGKNTVLALCLALQLNLDESKDLLAAAGYSLSNSSIADLVLSFCIQRRIYKLMDVNDALAYYGIEPLALGA